MVILGNLWAAFGGWVGEREREWKREILSVILVRRDRIREGRLTLKLFLGVCFSTIFVISGVGVGVEVDLKVEVEYKPEAPLKKMSVCPHSTTFQVAST